MFNINSQLDCESHSLSCRPHVHQDPKLNFVELSKFINGLYTVVLPLDLKYLIASQLSIRVLGVQALQLQRYTCNSLFLAGCHQGLCVLKACWLVYLVFDAIAGFTISTCE